jgi:hypothetical protein
VRQNVAHPQQAKSPLDPHLGELIDQAPDHFGDAWVITLEALDALAKRRELGAGFLI